MATIAPPVQASATLAASTFGIAKRGLLKYLRTPQLVVLGTIQGALFLLIFRYVFGGAIGAGGLDYVDFLVPGFITTGILFSGMGAAAGVAEDLQQGLVDRLRCPSHEARYWPGGPWPTPPCWSGAWPSPRPSASRSASASTAR
jgi:ABC-2 type transporter